MNSLAMLVSAGLLLGGCVGYNVRTDGTTRARIGQTVRISNFQLTPLEVLEDSRCPANVQCVWAGRLRIKARMDVGTTTSEQELVLGQDVPAGRGTLQLVEARPHPDQGRTIYPEDYRFGFTYQTRKAN
jgi:hypothetical protein